MAEKKTGRASAVKSFFGYQIHKLSFAGAKAMPPDVLKRLLRALHYQPDIAARAGYQVYPDVFYNPFPSAKEIDVERLKLKRSLPGIKFELPKMQSLLGELAVFAPEVKELLAARAPELLRRWNDTYPPADSAMLYAMLRHLKPKKYIEVGCGYSSRVSTPALLRNASEKSPCEALYIEPYPPAHLAEFKLAGEFVGKKIQQMPLEHFTQLEAGDVLFIDTSHVIKSQNDVEYELIQILPSLKPGVWVHIHDIFTPYDYPAEWLIGSGTNRGGNNEQYALECLLSGGGDWEATMASFLLWKDHRELYQRLVVADYRPASFWIRKKERTGASA